MSQFKGITLGGHAVPLAPSAGGGALPAEAGRAKAGIPYVGERDFEREVLHSDIPVLVYFTADWCAPCKQIAPEVESFAQEVAGKVKVIKVDVDKAQLLARELRIQSVPTFMLFAQQRLVDAVVGAVGKKKLREMIEPVLPRPAGALKPAELAQLVVKGMVVPIDTRDAASFGRVRIPGAVHMPFEEIETRLAELHMLAERPVLYCRSGDKTKDLAARLAEEGLPVAFLEGGLLAWEAAGLKVDKP